MNQGRLIEQLEKDEGFVSHAYQDSEGLWTIGFGRLIDRTIPGAGITKDEARMLLRNNVSDVVNELDEKASWWRQLPEAGQEAFANMAFNLGWPRLSRFKNMIEALKARDYGRAADEALNSKWAQQVGTRAERIATVYRSLIDAD